MNQKIPILVYHSISEVCKSSALKSLAVTPKKFNRQMWILNKLGWQGLSMTELMPYLTGKKSGKVFGLTFDDGYQDNYLNALPILKKFGFSATNYIVTDLIHSFNKWDIEKGIVKRNLMSAEEISKWIAAGCEIGSHTKNHVDLTELSDHQLQQEISLSKQALENSFNQSVVHFCYPYGKYSPKVIEHVKQAGYHTALTTDRSRATASDNFLQLPRVIITRNTPFHVFLMKVLGKYEDRRRYI